MNDTFIIISDSNHIHINPRIHDKEIVVCPCRVEHWISTDLFKFRIYAEREQLHVIGICSTNQIPLYGLFCDEIILVKANQTWYEDVDCPISQNGNIIEQAYVDIEFGEIRKEFTGVDDNEVVERFAYRKVYFLESAYNKFLEVKAELPCNVIIVEFKKGFTRSVVELDKYLPAVGIDHCFQRDLIKRTGAENYLTIQIMASVFLNWQFLCCGGSSNLLCVVPVKAIAFRDPTIDDSTIQVIKGFSRKRYGFDHIPFINRVFNIGRTKNTKRGKQIIRQQGLDEVKQIEDAFETLTQFQIPPEISFTNRNFGV